MKFFFGILCLVIIGLQSNAQTLEDLSFGTDTTLEIVTWNIEWFPKNGQTTVNYVSQIIQQIDADVFALQEIDNFATFTTMVDNLPGWDAYYVDDDYSGLAYIYNTETIELIEIYEIYPSNWREFPRAPCVFKFKFKGENYTIINNHLKCCGNGYLNLNDPNDEETRRYDACNLLNTYINYNLPDANVFLVGDFNDELTDGNSNNVFQIFLNNPSSYKFVDMDIANGSSAHWSYPSWPSHLDHILITNELFDEFENSNSVVQTIEVDDYLSGGWNTYDNDVSDHRPVGFKFKPNSTTGIVTEDISQPQFSAFPNPTTGLVQFRFTQNEVQKLSVFNIMGKQIIAKSGLSQNETIDLSDVESGIYIVSIQTDSGIFTKKIIRK